MEDIETEDEPIEKPKPIPRLNSSDAIRKIEDINDIIAGVQKDFVNNSREYCSCLSEKWGSNKAIEFSEKLYRLIEDIDRELVYLDESTVGDACSSFNGAASSHDTRSIYVSAGPFLGFTYGNFKDSVDGKVGMYPKDVQNLTKEYIAELESLKGKISAVPRSIGFYDVNGSLVKTFNTKADRINSIVNDSIDSINREVMTSINEEIDLTEQTVNEATSVISS